MKIIDNAMLQRFRNLMRCELCRSSRVTEPHHAVYTRGHCRLDIACNLVALCRSCHQGIDNKVGRERCIEIIADREGVLTTDVEAVCRFFRNLPKGKDPTKAIMDCGHTFSYRGAKLFWKTVDAMPDQSPPARPLAKKPRRKSAKKLKAKAYRKGQYQRAKKLKAGSK